MTIPKVCIIILNWNGLQDTIECLESLKCITYPSYQVIVVDNGSEGRDVEVLRDRFKDYIYIIENDKNYGFAEGNNIGIRFALENMNPDYIWLLNNDTAVHEESLTELIKTLERDREAAVVGPKICGYENRSTVTTAGGKMNWLLGFGNNTVRDRTDLSQFDVLKHVDFVSGSALLIRADVVREIGLLDSKLFLYNEDVDWCLRVKKAGYSILYTPTATVFHKSGASTKYLGENALYYNHRNRILIMSKHATKKQLIVAFLPMFTRFVGAVGYYFAHGKLTCVRAVCRAYYDGMVDVLMADKGK